MTILKLILSDLGALVQFFIVSFPKCHLGRQLRRYFWGHRLQINDGFVIERCAIIGDRARVKIGKNFKFGEHSEIAVDKSEVGVWIGDDVAIARYAWLRAANHSTKRLDIPIAQQGHEQKIILFDGCEYSIVIEDDVWIAPNVTVLTGTHIGKGSVIGAGAVVGGKIPQYSIVVGNPSRVVANRKKIANLEKENGN